MEDTISSGDDGDKLAQNLSQNVKIKSSKKHKKKETKGESTTVVADTENEDSNKLSMQDLRRAVELLAQGHRAAKTSEEVIEKKFQFWSTQPVPKMDEDIKDNGAIEPDRSVDTIRAEPYSLPEDFQWDTLNLRDDAVLAELYQLLNENYVEDDDAMFRFDYPAEFLKWALLPPGSCEEWHLAVRVTKSGKLVGFISAVPATMRMFDKFQSMVEINFLCVHKRLRSRRVAPVLIREITRRVHLKGIFQAVYTAGVVLPKPLGTCRYWHRSLNPKKLIEVKFSHLGRHMTLQRTLKLYRLPEHTKTPGLRQLREEDLENARALLSKYLSKFSLAPAFSAPEFQHWFLPRKGIVDSFIVEAEDGTVTDFISYYSLPSTVMHHPTYHSIKAAYAFYNVSTTTPWLQLMGDALITAKSKGFDVFNALDLMDNNTFLEPLKFGMGDGNLQYYLYNWRCPSLTPDQIGLVLQ